MNKRFFLVLLVLFLLCSQVFALSFQEKRELALNTMFGNPYKLPILNGSDVIITKNNPTDLFWFYCSPVKNITSKYSHFCFICKECN